MSTPGNNGASTPEDDDPFGYLYADGQARGAQPPTGSYGYPNAVNRARPVGERQYGQQQAAAQAPTAQYGQVPPQQAGYGQPQGAYGQPNAHYQAPESFGGPQPPRQQQPHGGGGRGRGPNTKGLLIGAIAVVAAVLIGIGVAMLSDGSDNTAGNGDATPAQSTDQSAEPSETASKQTQTETNGALPKAEAKTLVLGGNAITASDIPGAKSEGGFYVTNFNSVGSSLTWKMKDVPEGGKYTLYVLYGVPGKAADATLTVNGTPQGRDLNLDNFSHAPEGDYKKGWTNTYASIQLNKGSNEIKISCEQGNSCDVNFDQLYLESGWK